MKEIGGTVEEDFLLKRIKDIPDYLIFFMDMKGHILSWNEGAEKLTGYLENEIIGKHFSKFYTEDEIKAFSPDKAIKTALKTRSFESTVCRVKTNGKTFLDR